MKKELEIAIKAAKEAGNVLMKFYGKTSHKEKLDKSLVTEADVNSEKKIRDILKRSFPKYSIIGEEFGDDKIASNLKWIIDPLDGTTNFAMRIPFFCLSIGLVKKEEPILGVIYSPFADELFYAEKGRGAYLNKKKISVSDKSDIKKSFLTFSHGSVNEIGDIVKKFQLPRHNIRQPGAAALELCYVAVGRTESYIAPRLRPWDLAAGMIIVREAGGKVTDFRGKEADINTSDIVASNGKFHEEILKVLK